MDEKIDHEGQASPFPAENLAPKCEEMQGLGSQRCSGPINIEPAPCGTGSNGWWKDRVVADRSLSRRRLLHDENQIVVIVIAAVGLASGRTCHFSAWIITELRTHRIRSGGGRSERDRRRVFRGCRRGQVVG